MTNYRIFLRDDDNRIIGREDFEAETDEAALNIAQTLFDACADACARFDLWRPGKFVSGPDINASDRRLSAPAEEIVVRTEELMLHSQWRIAHSRRLLERLNAAQK